MKLQVCWTSRFFRGLGLGLGLTLLAVWNLETWEPYLSVGYRFCSSCSWSLMAWLSAAKFFFLLFGSRGQAALYGLSDWSSLELSGILSRTWCGVGSVLQAIGTRGVLCMFSQDLEGPFTFGLPGFQCSKAILEGFATLVSFVIFWSWFYGWNLNSWTVIVTWSFRWLDRW